MHATEPTGNGGDAKPSTRDWGRFAYSIKDTAWLLAVSERMVRQLIADGELESFKVGAARRVHGSSIQDYVQRNRVTPEKAS